MRFFLKNIKQRFRLNLFKLQKIKKNINKIKSSYHQKNLGRIIIFTYELTHYQSLHLIYLGAVLKALGFDVYVAHCLDTTNACELKNYKASSDKVCSTCKITHEKLLVTLNLKSIFLKNNSGFSDVYLNKQDQGIINATTSRYYFGNEIKANADKRMQKIISTNFVNVSKFALDIDKRYEPDLVISNMTDYSYNYPIFKYFSEKNKFLQISATSLNHTNIVMDKFKLFPANKWFNQYIKHNPRLTFEQKTELDSFMTSRLTGENRVLKRYRYEKKTLDEIKDKIQFSKDQRNIFLFPNLHWDVGVSTKNSLFQDVIDWIGKTLEIVGNNDAVKLYLKPHPEENFSKHVGEKGIIDSVLDRGYDLPKNLTIIDNNLGIRPFDLFPLIDLGIVSSGTLGLEMLYCDIPNINVGVASYSGTELDSNIKNLLQYENAILGNWKFKEHSREQIENFLYFYFLATQFKWPLGKKFNYDESFSVNNLTNVENKDLNRVINQIKTRIQNI